MRIEYKLNKTLQFAISYIIHIIGLFFFFLFVAIKRNTLNVKIKHAEKMNTILFILYSRKRLIHNNLFYYYSLQYSYEL